VVLKEAIEESIEAGVVYVVAAGNSSKTVELVTPANVKPAITVSALADYDGKPGGKSSPTCENYGSDDHLASFSNFGSTVDMTAPGVCILSTEPSKKYGLKTGTSMASPHVAGAAALLAAQKNPNSAKDVEAIATTLKETGNFGWTDTSGDGVQEPLLDVSNESTYSITTPPLVVTSAVTYIGVGASTETFFTGTVNPKGLTTTYQFEYVEAAKYKPEAENPYAEGAKLPVAAATLAGTIDKDYELQEKVSGLKASTTYHYRLIAENSKGITRGSDQTFTSLAACKGGGGQCEWSVQSPTNPEAEKLNELEDISCQSSSLCMAVGNDHYREKGFVESWNGSSWKMALNGISETKAISCPTSTWCMAIAKSDAKGWGLSWSEGFGSWFQEAKNPPTPEGATEVRLNDVSCTSESACTAVGRYYASGAYKPYVARWNGTGWSLQTAPSPSEGSASEAMLGVSCASSSFCVAVGAAAGKPFAERWNGSEWAVLSTANPGGEAALLAGVSCPTTSYCMAVGSYRESLSVTKTLAERWNGSNWAISSTPNPAKEGEPKLLSVSCLSSSSCIAVGRFSKFFPAEETTVAESWNGSSWALQTSPSPEGNPFNSLAAVSCSSTVACTGVGKARPKMAEANMVTMAQRWG